MSGHYALMSTVVCLVKWKHSERTALFALDGFVLRDRNLGQS